MVGGKKQKIFFFIMPICVPVHLAIFHQILSELGQIYHGGCDDPLMNKNQLLWTSEFINN